MAVQKNELEYSHKTTTFVFLGRHLKPPEPGSYDPAKWTPPTRQVFRVEIQNDGCWRIFLNGAEVAFGDGAPAVVSVARRLVEQHCSIHLLLESR
jgi:hypothetical protein